MRTTFKLLLAGAILLPVLTGCVVTETRSGYQFGFIDPGSTIQQFPSANGHVRLRRNLDGAYSLRFSDRLTVYNMGRHNSVQLVQTHYVPGQTAALFEVNSNGNCRYYELLTITSGNVDRHRINPGCQTTLEAGSDGDRMVIREITNNLRNYWVWSPTGVVKGRETFDDRPEIAHPSNPHYQKARREQEAAARQVRRQAQQATQRTASTTRTSGPASSSPAPVVPRSTPIRAPSGSLKAEVITPTRVILVGEGG